MSDFVGAPGNERQDARWTRFAVEMANQGGASQATPMTEQHLENLAECALGPTRLHNGEADRLFHLEHVAGYDVPLLVREIVRLWGVRDAS